MHESEFLSQEARCPAERDQRRFDSQRPAAAHRVDEVALSVPAGGHHHGGRQCFLHRRAHGHPAVAPARKRLARRVEINRAAVPVPMEENHHAAKLRSGVRAAPAGFAHAVADGILALQVRVAVVADRVVAHGGGDADVAVLADVLLPGDRGDVLVKRVGIGRIEIPHQAVHAVSRAKAEVQPHAVFERPFGHHAGGLARQDGQPQGFDLAGQQRRYFLRAGHQDACLVVHSIPFSPAPIPCGPLPRNEIRRSDLLFLSEQQPGTRYSGPNKTETLAAPAAVISSFHNRPRRRPYDLMRICA